MRERRHLIADPVLPRHIPAPESLLGRHIEHERTLSDRRASLVSSPAAPPDWVGADAARGRPHRLRSSSAVGARETARVRYDQVWDADIAESRSPPERAAMLVLVSGLPGVGKSSLVDSLAPRIGASVISRDQARLSAGHPRRLIDSLAWKLFHRRLRTIQRRAGRIVAATVERHLDNGRSVLVEVVAEPSFRAQMRTLAAAHNATFAQIECECPDRGEHHRRLATRPGFWRHALPRIEATYDPPREDCLRVQTTATPEQLATLVVAWLGAADGRS
jgi:predicted kinase